MAHVIFFDKVVNLIGGGSVINGPTPSSLHMHTFFYQIVFFYFFYLYINFFSDKEGGGEAGF